MIGRRVFLTAAGVLGAHGLGGLAAAQPAPTAAWSLALDHARALAARAYVPPAPLPAPHPLPARTAP